MKNDNGKIKNEDENAEIEKETDETKEPDESKDKKDKRSEHDKKIEELELKYKRALADYQNLEKRVREEKTQWIKIANGDLLLRLLPILDTLMMAAKHSQDQALKVTLQQFLDVLKAEGIERVEAQGKSFDPKFMECIDTKEGEEGKVLEEARAGFKLHDMVLRTAQVVVGKAV